MRLRNRVAIITGAARGIGRATALAFAKEGANVVVNDLDERPMEEVVASIRNSRCVAIGVRCDVTNPEEVKGVVNASMNEFGRIDIIVNNAGGSGNEKTRDDRFLEGIPFKVWEPMFDLNLKGPIHCTMAVLPHMMAKKYGKIVNISSQAGRYSSELSGPYYAAAKGGLLAFTRQVVLKVGVYGIHVNAMALGVTLTERAQKTWLTLTEEDRQQRLNKIPLRRLGTPGEIANVVLFLASDESSYITGATIDGNGGRFMS